MEDKEIDIYAVVKKLVGPTAPVGDTPVDADRLENVIALTELIHMLLVDIEELTYDRHSHMASVKAIGEHCEKFLNNIGLQD